MSTVSVVLPTYNRARWLPRTLDSILAQSYPPAEVLVVDDGSTDDTEEIVRSYPNTVRYLPQANAGVSAARNHGIKKSVGQWIAFADSDDLWHPYKLEVQLTVLADLSSRGWCITACNLIDPLDKPVMDKETWETVFPVFNSLGTTPDQHFASALERRSILEAGTAHIVYHGNLFGLLFLGNVGLPSSLLVHRDLISRVGLFDDSLRVAEETEFIHRLSAVAEGTIIMTPLVGYRVTQADSLTSHDNSISLIRNALLSGERAAGLRNLTTAEAEAYSRGRDLLLLRLAYAQLSEMDLRAARATVFEAWKRGDARTMRAVAIAGMALLPKPAVRAAHRAKRLLRRLR